MIIFLQRIAPVCTIFLALLLIESGVVADYADARSRFGGKSFSRSTPKKAPTQQTTTATQNKGGIGRGLAGGLLGGALAGLLFGSLFGAGGTGMGLLPILLLAGVGFFLFRRSVGRAGGGAGAARPSPYNGVFGAQGGQMGQTGNDEEQFSYLTAAEQGVAEIQRTDPSFDNKYFVEIASDVFFQVQIGWMRREIDSFKHLLGDQLAQEYAAHFAEMREAGHINKLESIAIRKVEVVNGGSDGQEDFVTVLFTANLLDYTVDDTTGDVVDGSATSPVKFAEEWSWARPTGTDNWLLEGIKVVSE